MSQNQWWAELAALKKETEEERCPDSLGLNLIEGKHLLGRDILNYSHLQVFGEDKFLRNMLQRVLVQDVDRKIPVIAIALTRESELPKEFYKVFLDKKPEESERFFHYEAHQKKSSPPVVFNAAEFYQFGKRQFIYIKLGAESASRDRNFLANIEAEIKTRFNRIDRLFLDAKRPAIYIFLPEKMEACHRITQYVESLSCYAAFRIFSKELQILSRDVSSLVYGPELYPEKTFKKMRKHSYWKFNQKRVRESWADFFGFEMPVKFKLCKIFSEGISIHQTAFGRFRISESAYEYVWFYPVQQSLGKEDYDRTHQSNEPERPKPALIKKDLPPEDLLTRRIIEDLKPKNYEIA